MKQIKFKDFEGSIFGGIQLDNGDVICGCCGCTYPFDEIGKLSDESEIEIINTYEDWVDFSDEIID